MKKIVSLVLTLVISFNAVSSLAAGLYNTYFVKSVPITENLDYVSYKGTDSYDTLQSVHILDFIPFSVHVAFVTTNHSLNE